MTTPTIPSTQRIDSHLLLVEDDILILRTMARGLRDAGYRVSEAESADEAIQICAAERPDLALLDIRLPGMSGLELSKWLAARDIYFVFLTAYDNQEFVSEAHQSGALGYLIKPMDVPRILPTLETALARSRDLHRLKKSEEKLVSALTNCREISTAVGVLVERRGVSVKQAFDSLRFDARNQQRRVKEVALELLSSPSLRKE
jgi:AmiR/NasT family two-component response regulator